MINDVILHIRGETGAGDASKCDALDQHRVKVHRIKVVIDTVNKDDQQADSGSVETVAILDIDIFGHVPWVLFIVSGKA